MKRAVLYARVSTHEQTPENQLAALRAFHVDVQRARMLLAEGKSRRGTAKLLNCHPVQLGRALAAAEVP